jgi:N-acetylneuraminic acid mutarotase
MTLALVMLACTVGPGTADTADPAGGVPGWIAGEPLPFPRQEHGVVALDGEVVVVGGVDDAPISGNWVQAYDPSTDTWRSLPELPVVAHHPNVVAVDGTLYLLGALDSAFEALPDAYHRLDPGSDRWTPLSAPPADRQVGAAGIAALDGAIHLVGGLHGRDPVAQHTVYDPVDDRYTALPDAPSARDHLALVAVEGRLVAAAGRAGGMTSFVASTEVFTEAEGWGTGTDIPTPRGGVAAAVLDGLVHVIGGEGADNATGVFATHEVYDPVTNRWSARDDMPSPRHGMGAAVIDGVLWVPGGAPVQGFGAGDVTTGYCEAC